MWVVSVSNIKLQSTSHYAEEISKHMYVVALYMKRNHVHINAYLNASYARKRSREVCHIKMDELIKQQ